MKSETAPGQGTPGILHSRDFRRYLAGQTASGFGSSLSSVALAFGVLSLTRSASSLGLVLLASRAPVICLALIGGALGDRWSRRSVMLATDAARTVLQAITAGMFIAGHLDVWSLGALQAAAGMASAVYSPAADGLVANLAPDGQIRQANSLLGLSAGAAQITALGLAGALVATVGPGAAFAVDAVTFAVSTISLAALQASLPAPAPAGRSRLLLEVGEGWRAVRSRSWLLTYAVHSALLNGLAIAPFLVLGPLVAERHLGGAPSWAAIGVGYAGGGFAGNAVVLRWRPRRPIAATLLSAIALAPLLAVMAAPGPLWLLVLAAIAAGGQSGIYNTVGTSTLLTHVDERLLSRVSSFVTVGGLLGVPAGMGLAGAAADVFGARAVLIFGAASVVVITLAALSVPSVWDGRLRSPGWDCFGPSARPAYAHAPCASPWCRRTPGRTRVG